MVDLLIFDVIWDFVGFLVKDWVLIGWEELGLIEGDVMSWGKIWFVKI